MLNKGDNPGTGNQAGGTTTQQQGNPPPTGGTTTTEKEESPPSSNESSTNTTTTGAATQVAPPPGVSIGFTDAGQFVLGYFSSNRSLGERWGMLSPFAQAEFGSQDAFNQYWTGFTKVSSSNAQGVSTNPDGSLNVPCRCHLHLGVRAEQPAQEHPGHPDQRPEVHRLRG